MIFSLFNVEQCMTYIKAFIMATGKTTLSGYAIISTGRIIKGHIFFNTHFIAEMV